MNTVGITGYGFYIPRYRIRTEEIADAHKKNGADIVSSLKIREKAVSARDEDTVTMAYEAGVMALDTDGIKREDTEFVLLGSETPAYAVKPSSTIIAEWLDIQTNSYLAFDSQFACKAATAALVAGYGLVKSGIAKQGMVFGSDKANAAQGDVLEFSAASGATAFVLGTENVAVSIDAVTSFSSDTPDFWRRSRAQYPAHAGRFTGTPAYFRHITGSVQQLFDKTHTKPHDYTYAVFHMPNGRFPRQIARTLGFEEKQYQDSLVVDYLGNSYAASSLMGLMPILEKAGPGDTILFASYGSGAGSDAISMTVHKPLTSMRKPFVSRRSDTISLDYKTYRYYAD